MTARIFVTGGTGFLGRRVVARLLARDVPLVLLDRSGKTGFAGSAAPGALTVAADLLQPERYAAALSSASVVLHMAGRTGRGSAHDHFRANADGTRALVDQCRAAGIERFLFISSIAAKFPDRRGYHYAQAKLAAEGILRASGMRFTIVRPTMILGEGSPILAALAKLALLPVMPIFGDGRTRVQPIHVDDIADFIVTLLADDRFDNETLELGGPVALSIEELIRSIRASRGLAIAGARGRLLHLPLGPTVAMLRAAEASGLARVLPVTAGQLASFRFDGTIDANPVHERRRAALRGIADMVGGGKAA
jgi:NADH dehydrogenase